MQSKITSRDALLAEIQKRKLKSERPEFIFTDFCFDKQVDFFVERELDLEMPYVLEGQVRQLE